MSTIKDMWAFAHHIIRSSRIVLNEKFKPLGLTSAESNILLQLLESGDLVRQEDLVEQLDVSKPAVSRALDTLQSKGFVSRERDLSDKRACLVVLTPKANEAATIICEVYNEIARTAEQGLNQEEIESFLLVFAKIARNFK